MDNSRIGFKRIREAKARPEAGIKEEREVQKVNPLTPPYVIMSELKWLTIP